MTEPLNTYGLRPNPQPHFKLFDVEGYQLMMALDGNDDGEGYGIRYTVPLDTPGLLPISVWMGVAHKDGEEISDEACAAWDNIFNETDQEGARKALQMIFDQAGSMLAEVMARQGESDD